MASLKLNITKLPIDEVLSLAKTVLAQLDPEPPDLPAIAGLADETASLKAVHATAAGANEAYEDALVTLAALKQARDAAIKQLRTEHTAMAAAVTAKAKGNPVVLAASGYAIAADKTHSTEPPERVTGLVLAETGAAGEVGGSHDSAARAKTYEVQLTTGDSVTGPYLTVLQPTATSWTLPGLTSGQRIWVRVRGIGAKGPGPWSNPATKIVP